MLVFVVGISSGGGPGYGTAWVVVYRIIWKSKQRVEEEEEEEVEIEEVVERFQMNKIKNRNQTRRNGKIKQIERKRESEKHEKSTTIRNAYTDGETTEKRTLFEEQHVMVTGKVCLIERLDSIEHRPMGQLKK